ncbi:MAG: hypothetical protein HUU35_18665, partial [Armatimonadetes bacterium]|nr:hypothetical protein [Armatimonadota bacterium]
RASVLARPPDPSFTAFRANAENYLKSGEEAYASLAVAALETMVGVYAKDPGRKTPWPEETTSGAILAAWDAFEECPLLPAGRRAAYVDVFLKLSRDLVKRSYEYSRIPNEDFLITWNHTTFPLLGLYFGGRYFDRYYHLPEAREWVERARRGFSQQAKSWKPQEDADSYLVLTMGHTIDYSLAEWDLAFFESGLIRQYADYVIACGDNRQWPAGFGDSGIHTSASMANAAVPYAWWWTKDPGYRWVLERANPNGYASPYWPEVPAVEPANQVGLAAFQLDPRVYTYLQRGPTYNEEFAPSEVAVEEAFDKIAFRESWHPADQYLLLDGVGRGKHLHFDTNAIIAFVQDTEHWLLDHDYLTRNTTEHNMLSVIKDGRAGRLVPGLAGLTAQGDLPRIAGTVTYVKGYNGVDWRRRILWRKGAWFLVRDEVTAREPGRYDLELTWKTIDRGQESVTPEGRFVAQRGQAGISRLVLPVDDPAAAKGRAVLLSAAGSSLAFGVDLPRGDYRITLRAWGEGTSSDSVWVGIDDLPKVAFHLPKGAYGPSSKVPDHSQPTPTVAVPTDGLHRVEVTLREAPPVRIDQITFERDGAPPVVVEAAAAPPPPAPAQAVASALTIEPVGVDEARVTKHVRQGISAPVAIYHQRTGRS